MSLPKFKQVLVRKAKSEIVAVTPIHDAAADLWLDQLLAEFEWLDWEVVWHIDRLSNQEHLERIVNYSRTIGYSTPIGPPTPFVDCDRNYAWQIAEQAGASWISLHDSDETYEPKASELTPRLLKRRCLYQMPWYNIWKVDSDRGLWIRVDKPFVGIRPRLYPIGPWTCDFKSTTASAYPHGPPLDVVETDIRILHWGFSTPELRRSHYERWHGKVNSGWWAGIVGTDDRLQTKQFDPNVNHQEWIFNACTGS